MFGGETSHLPLKLNTSGVIPPIFASSLLLLPLTMAGFAGGGGPEWTMAFGRSQPLYLSVYIALIVVFAFVYTRIVFNPADTADNLERHGGFVPGVRPGRDTSYCQKLVTRVSGGAFD
jgi:preprotein translocase subunit SecY